MPASVASANVQVPSDTSAPVVADFVSHAVRVAHIWRRDVERLPSDDWNVPGVYVLLADGVIGQIYVGKATELRSRLFQHRSKPKLDWRRAIIVKRDTSYGFHTSQIGYLEGRVASELRSIPGLAVVEGQQSLDTTLPPHDMLALDELVPSILAALRMAGVDLFKPLDEADMAFGDLDGGPEFSKSHTVIPGTVADLLAAGLLPAGAELHLSQGGRTARASVTATGEVLFDGVAYNSPSTAARIALGLRSSNGWTAWHVGSIAGHTLDQLRAQLNAQSTTV